LTIHAMVFRVAVLGLLVFAAVILVLYGTSVRNRWGLNFKAVHCPQCETPAPGIRMPKTLREFLWGGWTCRSCGTRIDKWGRPLGNRQLPTEL
jgi:hypothetical protein